MATSRWLAVLFTLGMLASLVPAATTSAGTGAPVSFRWVNQIRGPSAVVMSAAVNPFGETVNVGWIVGTIDLDPGPCVDNRDWEDGQFYAVKTDTDGNLLWARQLGGPEDVSGGVMPRAVAFDPSGSVVTVGEFADVGDFNPGSGTYNMTAPRSSADPTEPQHDVFVSKLDAAGNFVWARQLGPTRNTEFAWGATLDPSGNVVSVGDFGGQTDFSPSGTVNLTPLGGRDGFVWKLSSAGSLLWARQIGGATNPQDGDPDTVSAVEVDGAGNVFTTGSFRLDADFQPGPGATILSAEVLDAFAWKLSSAGNLAWARQFVTSYQSRGTDIAVDASGNTYVSGVFAGIIDLDPGPGSVERSTPEPTSPNNNGFLVKLNSAGAFLWGVHISGASTWLGPIVVDHDGGILVAGATPTHLSFDPVDIDPGPGVHEVPADSSFLMRLDAAGNFDWAIETPRIRQLSLAPDRGVLVAGNFIGGFDFDPGDGHYGLSSSSYPGGDPFVWRLDVDQGSNRIVRYAGTDRYCTAADVSAGEFPPGSGVEAVFVATGLNFPDALAGAAVAGRDGAPLLLVGTTGIPSGTGIELQRNNPQTIVILGGPSAVSAATETALGDYAPTVTRLAGASRFETAIAISQYGFPDSANIVFVANGYGFADALAAAPAAAAANGPILLTGPTALNPEVAAELARLNPSEIVVVGGTVAISESVFEALDALSEVDTVLRVYGNDRYATAVALSQLAFPAGADRVYLASGLNFPDALAGAAAAGAHGAPLLLVAGSTLPGSTATEIGRLGATTVLIVGGSGVIPHSVRQAVDALLE